MCKSCKISTVASVTVVNATVPKKNVHVPFCLKSLSNSLTTVTSQTHLVYTISPATSLSKHYTVGLFWCAKLVTIVSSNTSHNTKKCEIFWFLLPIYCCLSSLSAIISQILNMFLSLFLLVTRIARFTSIEPLWPGLSGELHNFRCSSVYNFWYTTNTEWGAKLVA